MNKSARKHDDLAGCVGQKLEYRAPVLTCFGLVTELTNSFSSACASDNAGCTPVPNGNMGPKL